MNETEKAYIAGIIDGEGCISIEKFISRGNMNYRLKLRVTNTNMLLMAYLTLCLGGCISTRHRKEPNCKTTYIWSLPGQPAVDCLKQVLPHLLLKKEVAELGIAFQKMKRGKGSPKTDKELAVEEAQYIIAKNLNKRGVEIL